MGHHTYVTYTYDSFWWVGMITSIEKGDAKIEFMHLHGPRKTFCGTTVADTFYVPLDILVMITAPTTKTGCRYTNSDYHEMIASFP